MALVIGTLEGHSAVVFFAGKPPRVVSEEVQGPRRGGAPWCTSSRVSTSSLVRTLDPIDRE